MKQSLFILTLLAFVVQGCSDSSEIDTHLINNPASASGEVDKDKLPIITFEKDLFEYGTVTQGEKIEHTFSFTNTGKSELLITSASSSCGCTIPDWPKKPIPPGGTGTIDVVFDTKGKSGRQHKQVAIVANTHPSTSFVALSGDVVAPESN